MKARGRLTAYFYDYHPLDVVITRGEGVWLYDVAAGRLVQHLKGFTGQTHTLVFGPQTGRLYLAGFNDDGARVKAFAWPEVYFPTIGWVEFNPTPSQPAITRPTTPQTAIPAQPTLPLSASVP